MDARVNVINKRLRSIKRVIAVSGGKGGIGKSVIASTLALMLAKEGKDVGLFDADFCGPSAHIILGVKDIYPTEEKGVIPPQVYGIKFMSINFYTKGRPSPFREKDTSSAFIEMFAVTQWGNLDFLIIDMPPGTKDVILDTIRFIQGVEFLIVTTASQVVLNTVKKTIKLVKEVNIPCVGMIENMSRPSFYIREKHIAEEEVKFLGRIGFDSSFEKAVGNPLKLLSTRLVSKLKRIIQENTDFLKSK